MNNQAMPAEKALEKLKEGNKTYLNSAANPGDVSVQIRKKPVTRDSSLMR